MLRAKSDGQGGQKGYNTWRGEEAKKEGNKAKGDCVGTSENKPGEQSDGGFRL